jgi:hypothetical protein
MDYAMRKPINHKWSPGLDGDQKLPLDTCFFIIILMSGVIPLNIHFVPENGLLKICISNPGN